MKPDKSLFSTAFCIFIATISLASCSSENSNSAKDDTPKITANNNNSNLKEVNQLLLSGKPFSDIKVKG